MTLLSTRHSSRGFSSSILARGGQWLGVGRDRGHRAGYASIVVGRGDTLETEDMKQCWGGRGTQHHAEPWLVAPHCTALHRRSTGPRRRLVPAAFVLRGYGQPQAATTASSPSHSPPSRLRPQFCEQGNGPMLNASEIESPDPIPKLLWLKYALVCRRWAVEGDNASTAVFGRALKVDGTCGARPERYRRRVEAEYHQDHRARQEGTSWILMVYTVVCSVRGVRTVSSTADDDKSWEKLGIVNNQMVRSRGGAAFDR